MSTTEQAPERGTAPLSERAVTLCEAFQITARRDPNAIALRSDDTGAEVTWAEYEQEVRGIAAGLAALGVGRDSTVALLLPNSPTFHLVDTAAMHLGATPYSVYATSSPEQVAYLFENAATGVVVTTEAFLPRVLAARAGRSDPAHVVCADGAPDGAPTLEDLKAGGSADFDFEAAWRAVEPDDIATLIYTSGTTGPPKGVQLTHRNLLAQCRLAAQVLPVRFGDRMTSYLPTAHIADRWASHYNSLVFGIQVTSVGDPGAIAAALPAVRPTFWGSVPRIFEKLKSALEAAGVPDPAGMNEAQKAAVRAKLGLDEARWITSGAAPIGQDVRQFFLDLGLPLVELYGMSEASCCISVAAPGKGRPGSVGPALPGVEARLAEDGELLIRGETVMAGYRNEPEKTAEAVDADGWLRTGDIATIDEDGYIRIVDRKKELIINAAGKNMSPANIENTLKAAGALIGQAVVIGDRRPYNVAILVIDPVNAAERSAADEDVRTEVAQAVERANATLSRVEQVKKYALLDEEWLPGGDELTPTMKLKRKPIADKYATLIEELYR